MQIQTRGKTILIVNGVEEKVTKKQRAEYVERLNTLLRNTETVVLDGFHYTADHALEAVATDSGIRFSAKPATDFSEIAPLVNFIDNYDPRQPIALDTETSFDKDLSKANHLTQTEIRFIQLAQNESDAIMIRVTRENRLAIANLLRPLLEDPAQRWIIHNARFDTWVLNKFLGLTIKGNIFDTLIMSQMLYAGFGFVVKHDLGSCCKRMLAIELDKSYQISDWAKPLTAEQIDYALSDVRVLPRLRIALLDRATKLNVMHVAALEAEFIHVASQAQIDGVMFDIDAALAYEQSCEATVEDLLAQLRSMFGEAFNPKSSPQKIKALNDALDDIDSEISLSSAAAPVLKQLNLQVSLPGVNLLLSYAKAEKQRQMVRSLINLYYQGGTGRIHTSFNPMGAQTGRLSATQPNTQNIPRGSTFRELFIAPPGKTFIICDFSQIELRIAAQIAGEKKMIRAFNNGEDLHTVTAVLIWGKGASYADFVAILADKNHPRFKEVKQYRQLAKSANFGLLYGAGWRGLQTYIFNSSGVMYNEQECRDMRDGFFRAYPGLAAWHKRLSQECKYKPYTETLFGRKRFFPIPYRDDDPTNPRRLTIFANSPTQGTGADAFKLAAVAVRKLINAPQWVYESRIVLMVHDEIVVETLDQDTQYQAKTIAQTMIDACAYLLKDVPVLVEPDTGCNWADKH